MELLLVFIKVLLHLTSPWCTDNFQLVGVFRRHVTTALNIANDGPLPPVKEHFWETKGSFETCPSSLLGDVHLKCPSIKEYPALFF